MEKLYFGAQNLDLCLPVDLAESALIIVSTDSSLREIYTLQ